MKTPIEDIRRRDLTEAALATLQKHGLRGATVARVAAAAGMSPGIVHHYFKDKAELLEATMRRANAELGRDVIALLRRAVTPRARLDAILRGNFAAHIFRPEIAQSWLAFLAEVPYSPRYARVQRVLRRRMHSNLLHCLRPLLPAGEAERAAQGMAVLVDGLWLRCGLGDEGIDHEAALRLARDYVARQLPAADGPR